MHYKATIQTSIEKDSYTEGILDTISTIFDEVTGKSLLSIIEKLENILEVNRKDWIVENLNNYPDCTEIFIDRMVNKNNSTPTSEELRAWKINEAELYNAHTHVYLSQVITIPAEEEALKALLIKEESTK